MGWYRRNGGAAATCSSNHLVLALTTAIFALAAASSTWSGASAAVDSAGDGLLGLRSEEEIELLFTGWRVKYEKSYGDVEEAEKRFEIFKDNLRYIDQRNRPENNHTFTLGLKYFADLSNEEYRSKYLTNSPIRRTSETYQDDSFGSEMPADLELPIEQVPASIDWRRKGAVGPVKNQGSCGSCWAFAAVATVEGINAILSGLPVASLSEQEILDCSDNVSPCNGGWMSVAYNYIIRNKGIDAESHYPYKAKRTQCWADRRKVAKIDGYANGTPNREDVMTTLVARQPIAVAIDASGRDFQHYAKGVFDGVCGVHLDHAVTVVGYGSEGGKDYWLVKNSWSKAWGDSGYIKMRRNIASVRGKCGIAMAPMYPTKLILHEST